MNTLALIDARGRGSRLEELTDWRVKPAVPFGGKFRIIDFGLSNCVNSGIRRMGICTQYKAQSLIRRVQPRLELSRWTLRRIRGAPSRTAADAANLVQGNGPRSL